MPPAPRPSAGGERPAKKGTLAAIQAMERAREERRVQMEARKDLRKQEKQRHRDQGVVGDVDFVRMISSWREVNKNQAKPHATFDVVEAEKNAGGAICICVRKRPISQREVKNKDHDAVSCVHPSIVVHDCRLRVDGISKYLANAQFAFDHAFSEEEDTAEIYRCVGGPLVEFVTRDEGRACIFAYGQTGSGKTYTMEGVQARAAVQVFRELAQDRTMGVSFFEIYGGRCQDLLRDRARLQVREDGKGDVHVVGLAEAPVDTAESLLAAIERGNELRTKQKTEVNDASSRSHAVCRISIRDADGKLRGTLSLVDLAGSERGQDTRNHNRQLRTESAEINKSLLALKECIRGLATNNAHVPFRASKLTMVLRDSFVRPRSRVAMIACVSPSVSAADHTINTLRYADRVKEKPATHLLNAAVLADKNLEDKAVPIRAQKPIPRPPTAEPPVKKRVPKKPVAEAKGGAPAKREAKRVAPRRAPPPPAQPKAPPARAAAERESQQKRKQDDLALLHATLERGQGAEVAALHKTVDSLFEAEESLLNAHMTVIQENAELLTEEGRMLQQVQGGDVVDYDIDTYVARLGAILDRKAEQIASLQGQLAGFAAKLREEEDQSRLVRRMPMW